MADAAVSIDFADLDESSATNRTRVRSEADGGIVTQLRLDHPSLFLRPTLRQASDVTIEPDYWTTVEGGRTLVFVTAYGSDEEFEAFESTLETDPTLFDPVCVDRYPDRRVYRLAVAERTLTVVSKTAEFGGRLLDCCSTRDGWQVQIRFPERDALIEFNQYCRDRDVSVAVEHLRVSDDEDDGVIALTEKQQELLAVAHEEGYFDVPRGISQDELADRLGVSKSAISQRLRRSIGALCASSMSTR